MIDAVITLAIDEGIQGLSISKIAKKAKLASATIYLYYENKEALIKGVYIYVKDILRQYINRNISITDSGQKVFEKLMSNLYTFIVERMEYLLFIEMCSLNPSIANANTVAMFEPIFSIVENKIKENTFKKIAPYILLPYCYNPIVQLAKDYRNNLIEDMEERFKYIRQLSWEAIKA
ncbi:TetR/AcrR family transcriptional regulator [Campylobacter sp. TTU_617]|nr:TetR/AcrR family transcriptional regulator [Campylobacter sp. TTU_617]